MDKRKNNGNKGHSTKSNGVDKRRNQYKEAIEQAGGVKDVVKVLKMLFTKATMDSDTTAAKIYLEYYLGKPRETKDLNIIAEQKLFSKENPTGE